MVFGVVLHNDVLIRLGLHLLRSKMKNIENTTIVFRFVMQCFPKSPTIHRSTQFNIKNRIRVSIFKFLVRHLVGLIRQYDLLELININFDLSECIASTIYVIVFVVARCACLGSK